MLKNMSIIPSNNDHLFTNGKSCKDILVVMAHVIYFDICILTVRCNHSICN